MFENVKPEDLEAGRRALGGGGVGAKVPLTVSHGEGAVLYDTSGKAYIDCTAQAWSLNTGYSHPKIIAAVSEQIARMVAMKSASDNAKTVIGELKLVYNKTRQAAITKELSEIVSGAAAV